MRLCEEKVKSGESQVEFRKIRENRQRATTNIAINGALGGGREMVRTCNQRLAVGTISAA